MTRRVAIGGAAAVGVAGVAAIAIASSGGDDDAETKAAANATPAEKPQTGGRLRVSMAGAGLAETFNPALVTAPIDTLRLYAVFDPMVRAGKNFQTEPGLATEWQRSKDGRTWEVRLRDGVTWHDGKPFTADDVIYTWRGMADAKHYGHAAVTNIRLDELKKLSPTLLRVPLRRPDARLQDSFIYHNSAAVIQDGTKKYDKPVGTGPFSVVSFKPGERSLQKKNPDYWDEGKPYVDELEIISIDDDSARINALLGGDIDILGYLPFAQAKPLSEGGRVNVIEALSGPGQVIYMRTDQPPFNDNRVRLAMKLIADRQAMIDSAFSGHGEIMNDIAGKGLPFYNSDLPQHEQDIEQAKSLLKQAGAENLTVSMVTSTVFVGQSEAATLYAEQAKQAGVTVKLNKVDPSTFFSAEQGYLKHKFSQDAWPTATLAQFYELTLLSDSPVNETWWKRPEFDKLIADARSSLDDEKAKEYWDEAQKQQWEEGGNIFWAARKTVDATSKKVGGVGRGWFFSMDNYGSWNWYLKS